MVSALTDKGVSPLSQNSVYRIRLGLFMVIERFRVINSNFYGHDSGAGVESVFKAIYNEGSDNSSPSDVKVLESWRENASLSLYTWLPPSQLICIIRVTV